MLCLSAPAWAESESRLTEEKIPLAQDLPERPRLLLELGDDLLGNGTLNPGFELPTGAVWQPSLIVFGTLRSAYQHVDTGVAGAASVSEWVNRLDIFANLSFTASERFLLGLRPLDESGRFTGYDFHGTARGDGYHEELDTQITTAFFEGDFGEIFPMLDLHDSKGLDIGFSIGRQPLFFQEGIIFNDSIEAIGVTFNSRRLPGTSNIRVTGVYGWDEVNRGGLLKVDDAEVFALLTEVDLPSSTVALDMALVKSDRENDSFVAALSSIQRIGPVNTSFRAAVSTVSNKRGSATSGLFYLAEMSLTPTHTDDLLYLNVFSAERGFTPAAHDPARGGVLDRVGILFASSGIGSYVSALDSQPNNAYGFSLGYQYLFGPLYAERRQLIFEVGARRDTGNSNDDQYAAGVRFQQAVGKHMILGLDGYVAKHEVRQDRSLGGRAELTVKF